MTQLEHGGRLDAAIAKYGGERTDWLDLSTGINPVPWPIETIPSDVWHRLPDEASEQDLLRAAWSYYGVPDKYEIVAANGTQALIQLIPSVLEAKDAEIVSPTYGEHEHVWRASGANVQQTETLTFGNGCLVVVNPNNPTGTVYTREELLEAAWQNRFVVLDEAFVDPDPDVSLVSEMPDNVLILKSFGKFFGLAGLRLGFVICSKELASRFRARLGSWAVSGPALFIGMNAMQDTEWIVQTRARLKSGSDSLCETLSGNGLSIAGANPLFVSARCNEKVRLFDRLAEQKILIRNFSHLPGFYRFGLCRDREQLQRLSTALSKSLNE